MKVMKNKWITLPSLAVILLMLLQVSVSFYSDYQAKQYVSRIIGMQEGPIEDDGFLISFSNNTTPPSCPVSLEFLWKHKSGYAFIEEPTMFDALRHNGIARIKNGYTTKEPLTTKVVNELRARPGEWHYTIIFEFDCSFVKNEWVSWINFDKPHTTLPIVVIVEDINEE